MSEIDQQQLQLNRTIQAALNTPHQLLVIDRVLAVKSGPEQVQITLGWDTPSGVPATQATIIMPRSFANQLGKILAEHTK
jgi:hypothetical protein